MGNSIPFAAIVATSLVVVAASLVADHSPLAVAYPLVVASYRVAAYPSFLAAAS